MKPLRYRDQYGEQVRPLKDVMTTPPLSPADHARIRKHRTDVRRRMEDAKEARAQRMNERA